MIDILGNYFINIFIYMIIIYMIIIYLSYIIIYG